MYLYLVISRRTITQNKLREESSGGENSEKEKF